MAWAEALPMMHNDGRQLVEEMLVAEWRVGGGVFAAVRLHVQLLLELDVDADLLPVVTTRPPDHSREQNTRVKQTACPERAYTNSVYTYLKRLRCNRKTWGSL